MVEIGDTADASGNSMIELFDLQEIESQRMAGQAPRLTPQAQIVQRTEITHPNIQMGNTTDAPSDQNRETDTVAPDTGSETPTRVFEIRISADAAREVQAGGVNAFVPVRLDTLIADPAGRVANLEEKPHPGIALPSAIYGPERKNAVGFDLSDPLSHQLVADGRGVNFLQKCGHALLRRPNNLIEHPVRVVVSGLDPFQIHHRHSAQPVHGRCKFGRRDGVHR